MIDEFDERPLGPSFGIEAAREVWAVGDTIHVEDAALLFQGHYERMGADLVISDVTHRLRIHDYFTVEKRPALVAPNGASLRDDVIVALSRSIATELHAQHGQSPVSDASTIIGRVQTVSGSATIVRNGVSLDAHAGDLVYKGDIVQTDRASALAIAFLDGTLFSLSGSARMILNDMVYKADGIANSALFNLVQGSISFVAGQVAKTGDMKVSTPVAVMGIRGTAVQVQIDADNGTTRFSLMTEPDGHTGRFDVYDRDDSTRLLFTVSDSGQAFLVQPTGPQQVKIDQLAKTPFDVQTEAVIVQTIFKTLADVPRLPVPQGPVRGGPGSGTEPNILQPNAGPQEGPRPGGAPSEPREVAPSDRPPDRGDRPDGIVIPHADRNNEHPQGSGEETPHLVLASQNVAVLQDSALVAANAGQGVLAPSAGSSAQGLRIVAARVGPDAASDGVALADGTVVLAGRFGTLILHQDGTYLYRADQAAALAEGQHGTDTFSFQVQDDAGTSATATLTVDVTGVNDVPVLAANDAGSHLATENSGAPAGGSKTAARTTLSFTDVDLSDTHSVAYAAEPATWSGGPTIPADLISALSRALTLTESDATGSGAGSVTATFALADELTAFLSAGETLTATYIVTVKDDHGAASTQPVTFTIAGVNDAPVLAADTAASHAVTGVAGSSTRADATLGFTDADLNDTHAISGSLNAAVWSVGSAVPADTVSALSRALTLTGSDATGTGAGSVTASFGLADTLTAFLAEGETLTATYAVTVTDDHGAASTQPVTFAVAGVNDAPVLAADAAGSHTVTRVADGTGCTAIDLINAMLGFADADLSDMHTVQLGSASAIWSAGPLTCLPVAEANALFDALDHALSFTLSDSVGAGSGSVDLTFSVPEEVFDFLGACDSLSVTYEVTVTDDHGAASTQPVTFTVADSNEALHRPIAKPSGTANVLPSADRALSDAAHHAANGNLAADGAEVATADHMVRSVGASGQSANPEETLHSNDAAPLMAPDLGGATNPHPSGAVLDAVSCSIVFSALPHEEPAFGHEAHDVFDSTSCPTGSVEAHLAPGHDAVGKPPSAGEYSDAVAAPASNCIMTMINEAGHATFVFPDRGARAGPIHAAVDVDTAQNAIGRAHSGDAQCEPIVFGPVGGPTQDHDLSADGNTGATMMHLTPNVVLQYFVKASWLDHLEDQCLSGVTDLV
ncbi:VCBS domain-containing protein [Methylobacterium durans]|uniref:VCBS domain-containing protein n=1 Tax=Methylobacterium durans TaxID=2202825 RepID=UPI002AFFABC4|nr:VCBS domain-containing protein [Methylobacterium durans]MEA1835226.1 VCBS domain-containing protein [Methylobacterium durans]